MMWMTNAAGQNTYISPELAAFSGRQPKALSGLGWLAIIHPDDRELASKIVAEAAERKASFSIHCRIQVEGGFYVWVVTGALPSFGPPGRTFLGFLGSLTQLATGASLPTKASGRVGVFDPPPPHPMTAPGSELEQIADHVLMARAKAEVIGFDALVTSMELAMILVGRRLSEDPRRIH